MDTEHTKDEKKWLTIAEALDQGYLHKADTSAPTKATVIRWCRETHRGIREWFKVDEYTTAVRLGHFGKIKFYEIHIDALKQFQPQDNRRELSPEDVHDIHILKRDGFEADEIAEQLNFSVDNVHSVLSGRTWKPIYDHYN